MNYDSALKYINSREKFGIKLGLKNINSLMLCLDNPQDSFKCVHVAGTNGKGSVCSVIASVLMKAGYKVGVYTSPHLVDFRERIRINSSIISKKDVCRLLTLVKKHVKQHTYFEIVTALAFLYFKLKKVDIALIEVGMGGRLDATNVVNPMISVITNISLEHTDHLGGTVNKIAFEKAGIIKDKVPVVVSKDCKGISVIKKICKSKKCKLYKVRTKKVFSGLKGEFQYQNVSIALKVVKLLKYKISKNVVSSGLKSAKWPGRFDFISKNLIFDCAHNPAGAKALAKDVSKLGKKVIFVVGIMKDKDIKHMVDSFEKVATEIIISKPKINRAAVPKNIAKFVHKKVVLVDSVDNALEYAKLRAGKNGLVVLTGSIYTVGEAFSLLKKKVFQ